MLISKSDDRRTHRWPWIADRILKTDIELSSREGAFLIFFYLLVIPEWSPAAYPG